MTYRYETIVDRHLNVVARSGAEWMARCIWHDDSTASLQINVDKGLYLCFACGARGNIKTLQKFLGIRIAEEAIDVNDIRARLDALRNPDADVQPVLEESYLDRFRFPSRQWEEWGFSPVTVASFDLGFDPIGNYLTIPVRNIRGELLGVIRRFLDDDYPVKYKYPKGFKRASNLFASWMVEHDEDTDTVVLVEGAKDAMKVWQAGHAAMAVYGSSLSPTQVRVLRRLGVGRVVLFFDNDKAGKRCADSALGWHVHKRGRLTLREYRPDTDLSREFIVERTVYPRSFPFDPGGMDEEQIEHVLTTARRVI